MARQTKLIALAVFLMGGLCFGSRPMEPVTKTLYVFVHGTGGKSKGFIDDGCDTSNVHSMNRSTFGKHDDSTKIYGFAWWHIFSHSQNYEANLFNERPMMDPADGPDSMAHQLGDKTWTTNVCGEFGKSNPKSLIEDAVDKWFRKVGAQGFIPGTSIHWHSLQEMRDNPIGRQSIPSRVVLISHSVGGLDSREYITSNYYNGDVDKWITMDTPHKGTPSLSTLLDAQKAGWGRGLDRGAYNAGVMATGLVLLSLPNDVSNKAALWTLSAAFLAPMAQQLITEGIDGAVASGGLYIADTAGIVNTVPPHSNFINGLNSKVQAGNGFPLPAFRVFHGTNGICFGSTLVSNDISLVVPGVLTGTIGNFMGGLSSNLPSGHLLFATVAGALTGMNFSENGTNIVPNWSSTPVGVPIFNLPNSDLKHLPFEGHDPNPFLAGIGALLVEGGLVFEVIHTMPVDNFTKTALKYAYTLTVPTAIIAEYSAAQMQSYVLDGLMDSHSYVMLHPDADQLKGPVRAFTRIAGPNAGKVDTIQKTSFEDYLFEKPFVQLRVANKNDGLTITDVQDPSAQDTMGFYDSIGQPISLRPVSGDTALPIDYNELGWDDVVGIKKDVYRYTSGINADHRPVLRDVHRYHLPPVAINDFVHKYEFIVDDVRPDLMEQIKINFNWNYSLIWQRESQDTSLPYVLYRERFGSITKIGNVKSPIDDNGLWIVKPFDPPFLPTDAKSIVQKENQNTISISLVNKAGYVHTQQLFFLSVLTKPVLSVNWPLRGVTLSTRKPIVSVYSNLFGFHKSGITYDLGANPVRTGFKIFPDTTQSVTANNLIIYDGLPTKVDSNGETFIHRWKSSTGQIPAKQGRYIFLAQVQTKQVGANGALVDNYQQRIPFVYDTTAPDLHFVLPAVPFNPDSTKGALGFGFAQGDSIEAGEEKALRFVRARIMDGSANVFEFAPKDHVFNSAVSYQWNGMDKTNHALPDGKYTFQLEGFDYAVPSSEAYQKVLAIHQKVLTSKDNALAPGFDSVWSAIANGYTSINAGFNGKILAQDFVIDRTPPQIQLTLGSTTISSGDSPNTGVDYSHDGVISKNEQLKIDFKVIDRQTTTAVPVKVRWRFLKLDTINAVSFPATQEVLVSSNQFGSAEPQTFGGASIQLLPDGKYKVYVELIDQAGNRSGEITDPSWTFRVDRAPPDLQEMHTNSLTYRSNLNSQDSAIWKVSESGDVPGNQNGALVKCFSRNTDPSGNSYGWQPTQDLQMDSLPQSLFSGKSGRWTIDVSCVDAAGNESRRSFAYYVDHLAPTITSPTGKESLKPGQIGIYGIAPNPDLFGLENVGSYSLSWRKTGDSTWDTTRMFVPITRQGVGRKNNVAETVVPAVDYLGYWNSTGLENASYEIKVESAPCVGCPGEKAIVEVMLSSAALGSDFSFTLTPLFTQPLIPKPGSTKQFGLKLSSQSDQETEFQGKIFGQDSQHNILFEDRLSGISASKLHGKPNSTAKNGIYLWQDSSAKWNVQTKNFGKPIALSLQYFQDPDSARSKVYYQGQEITCGLFDQASSNTPSTGKIVDKVSCLEIQFGAEQTLQGIFEGKINRQLSIQIDTTADRTVSFALSSAALFNVTLANPPKNTNILIPASQVYVGQNAVSLPGAHPSSTSDFFIPQTLLPTTTDKIITWNSLRQSGSLPKPGTALVRAEMAYESSPGNFRVQVAESKFEIAAVDLALSTGLQPSNLILQNAAFKDTSSGLSRITCSYGLQGQDAYLTAGIINSTTKSIVKTFFSRKFHNATVRTNDHEISWNGIMDQSFLAPAGQYEFFVSAYKLANDPTPTDSISRKFQVQYSDLIDVSMGQNPGLDLGIEESKQLTNGITYVVPKSDYKISALPTGKINAAKDFTYQVQYGGQQLVKVYPSERYSVGIRRRRIEFKGVLAVQMRVPLRYPYTDFSDGSCQAPLRPSRIVNFAKTITFTPGGVVNVDTSFRRGDNPDWRFMGDQDTITVYLLPYDGIDGARTADSIATLISNAENLVITPLYKKVFTSSPGDSIIYRPNRAACDTASKPDKICTNDAYNSNANLFWINGQARNSDFDNPTSYICSDYWSTIYRQYTVELNFRVPDEYWDPGFGFDNLANRNVRFDPTSKVVQDYFKKDGYGHNNAGSNGGADNNNLFVNAFEYQRFRLVPSNPNFSDPTDIHKSNPLSFGIFENNIVGHLEIDTLLEKFYGNPTGPEFELSTNYSLCDYPPTGEPICNSSLQNLGTLSSTSSGTKKFRYVPIAVGPSSAVFPNYFFDIRLKNVLNSRIVEISKDSNVVIPWPAANRTPIDLSHKPAGSTDVRFCANQATPSEGCLKAYNGVSGIQYFLKDGSGKINERPTGDYIDSLGVVIGTVNPDTLGKVDTSSIGLSTTPVLHGTLSFDSSSNTLTYSDVDNFKKDGTGAFLNLQGKTDQYNLTGVLDISAKAINITSGISTAPSSPNVFVSTPKPWDGTMDPHLVNRDLDNDGLKDEESTDISDDDHDHGIGEDVPGYLIARIHENDSDKTVNIPTPARAKSIRLLDDVYIPIVPTNKRVISDSALFSYNGTWIPKPMNVSLQKLQVRYIDGSEHQEFEIDGNPTSLSLDTFPDLRLAQWNVVRKATDFNRVKELITLRGKLPEDSSIPQLGTPYRVLYLSSGALKTAFEGLYTRRNVPASVNPILGYFNVSLLQGNTSLFLTYSQASKTYFKKLDVQIGSPVGPVGNSGTVSSLYGDATVFFNPNSFAGSQEFVTVRVINPDELEFSQSNNLSVVGPVVEVLPSHDFSQVPENQKPIVSINISRAELGSSRLPSDIKIYKPDAATGNIVELSNQSYVFYDASDKQVCLKDTTGVCSDPWTWFTISANTNSFSDFLALEKSSFFKKPFSFSVDPLLSKSLQRRVNVKGLLPTGYKMFVDDDPYYLNVGDSTPKVEIQLTDVQTTDSGFSGNITLPARFSSHLFLVPLINGVPANSEVKSVEVFYSPDDFAFQYTGQTKVLLGAANGQVVLPYLANHPGTVELILEKDGETFGLLQDKLRVPGGFYVWSGQINGAPISEGTYHSHLSAQNVAGEGRLIQGPDIIVDNAIPELTLSGQVAQDSSGPVVTLDYKYQDLGSGLAAAHLKLSLDGTSIYEEDLSSLTSPTIGQRRVQVSSRLAASCQGCTLVAVLTAMDQAGNSAEIEWSGLASKFRKSVVLNTTVSGANISNDVKAFPILVRLDASNFDFTSAQSNGSDIRFVDMNGNSLPFEIEHWDAEHKEAAIWVKTDVPGNAKTTIQLVWGNELASGGSNGHEVFGANNQFAAVWHLNEAGNSISGGYKDATANGLDGTGVNMNGQSDVLGVAGFGQSFNGNNQLIDIPHSANGPVNFSEFADYTLSAWVRPNWTNCKFYPIVTKGDKQYALQIKDDNNWEFAHKKSRGGWYATSYPAKAGKWVHLVGVRQGAKQFLYQDGRLVDSTVEEICKDCRGRDEGFNVNIGHSAQEIYRYFDGALDEIEISNTARSKDWIKLSYENQKSHQRLVQVDPDDFGQWSHSARLVLNTGKLGANSKTGVQNFPVLVRLRQDNFRFEEANNNGKDLRFADAQGIPLEYEIERWDAVQHKGEVWVMIPQIKGDDASQYVTMYWGNQNAPDRSLSQGVFSTIDGYESVWHMQTPPGANGSPTILDATANANHGMPFGNFPSNALKEGQVGPALDFDGKNDYFTNNLPLHKPQGTISEWLRPDVVCDMVTYFESNSNRPKWSSSGKLQINLGIQHGCWNFNYEDGKAVSGSGGKPQQGQWSQIVLSWDRSGKIQFYVNGSVVDNADVHSIAFSSQPPTSEKVGESEASAKTHWDGLIDDLKVLGIAADQNWIHLSYENQKVNQTLVKVVRIK